MDTKSRFSNLRLFKLNSASGSNHFTQSQPSSSVSAPPPPPKDRDGRSNFFLYTASSIGATSTPDLSYSSMRSPSSDYPRFQPPVPPFVQQASTSASTSTLVSPATALRKGFTKLSSLGRRGTKSVKIPHSPSLNVLPECNDEGISVPYNFQHNIHVNDNLQGMPPSWVTTLQAAGYTEEEINHLRVVGRERAATRYAAVGATVNSAVATMSSYPGAYATERNYISSPSQFGELYSSTPTLNLPSSNTHPRHNYANPPRSISTLSDSVRSSSPSNSRESSSPPPPVPQQPLLSPLYTQHFPGYAPSSHSHQTHSQSDYGDQTVRSLSPTETSSRAPTDAVTYSQRAGSSMNGYYPGSHRTVTPPINTQTPSGTVYRVVNEDPTPTTPPPAYASPNSPYRPPEKGLEKAFRWDTPSNTQDNGPSGSRSLEANTPPARNSTYKPPVTFDSQPYQSMHVTNLTSDFEVAPPTSSLQDTPVSDADQHVLSSAAPQTEMVAFKDSHDAEETSSLRRSLRDSPLRTPSPTSELDILPRTETPVNINAETPTSSPPMLAVPPRLSLHTDQDDDWSTILRFSFSGNGNAMNSETVSHDTPNNSVNQSQSTATTVTSPLTPKSKRSSHRSSIIYGPRRSPSVREYVYSYKAETNFSSRVGLEMGAVYEREEGSTIQNERTEQMSEEWADNYLDMKDGDYEENASYLSKDTLQKTVSEESSPRLEQHHSSTVYHSPRSAYLSMDERSPSPPLSLLDSFEQQEMINKSSMEFSSGTRSSVDADIPSTTPFQSRFSDITVHSFSPRTIEHSLPSPSRSTFVQSPKLAPPPVSPSSSIFSPTLSPTSAIRRTSVLSRRSFDLPPPLPPPEEDLPPTPLEAAMGLTNNLPTKIYLQGTQDAPLSPTIANNVIEQDGRRSESPASSSSRFSPQRPLSSTNTGPPTAPPPRRGLPPVPLQLGTGLKHNHVPMSSISSISSHNRSASGPFSSSNSMVVRPPPLPMPPVGKVLPSVIMQQRRAAAAANGDALLLRNINVTTSSNLTPSPSTSTFSHSSQSAYSADASEIGSVSDEPKLPTTPENQNTAPIVNISPINATQSTGQVFNGSRTSILRSTDADGDETIRIQDSIVSEWPPDEAQVVDADPMRQNNSSPPDMIPNRPDSVAEPPSPAGPLTPSIVVNGSTIVATQDQIHQIIPKAREISPSPVEVPLVLYPIREHISVDVNPLDMFAELQEIAQGQYGSVYAAQVRSGEEDHGLTFAVKKVPIPIKGTPKIGQLKRELTLMSKIRHEYILCAEDLFYEPVESMLWIRMELMERSLADILVLGEEGLEIEEPVIARFASDVLIALIHLNEQGIAHRDLRSDNLLINSDGILKLADLSNAVQVPKNNSIRLDIVGIHHWQAPEIRSGRYDALKIDVWSLGATVWECAEFVPPFSDIEDPNALGLRWPSLSRTNQFSKDFHDFLRLCSEPAISRPSPGRLARHPFVQTACPRSEVLSLLNICRSIEEAMQNGN